MNCFKLGKFLEFGRLQSYKVLKFLFFLMNFKSNAFCLVSQKYTKFKEVIIFFINKIKGEKSI